MIRRYNSIGECGAFALGLLDLTSALGIHFVRRYLTTLIFLLSPAIVHLVPSYYWRLMCSYLSGKEEQRPDFFCDMQVETRRTERPESWLPCDTAQR